MPLPQYAAAPDAATADAGYVVVSSWSDPGDRVGHANLVEYQRFNTLADALENYAEYERGEFYRARAVGIFAVNEAGMPLRHLSPFYLITVLREMALARGSR